MQDKPTYMTDYSADLLCLLVRMAQNESAARERVYEPGYPEDLVPDEHRLSGLIERPGEVPQNIRQRLESLENLGLVQCKYLTFLKPVGKMHPSFIARKSRAEPPERIEDITEQRKTWWLTERGVLLLDLFLRLSTFPTAKQTCPRFP